MTPVNFEGDINVKSQIVGYEYVLIEGDHKWGSFPDDSFDHACQCDMYGYLLECNQSGFPASSSDYGYCYDKYRSTGLEGQGDKYTNKFTKVAIVKGGHINASSLSAEQIEVNGTLTLGGVAREKWLQGSCPFGEFLTGIGVDGSFSCARASYSLQSIGNLDHWMDSSKYYTGNDVCLHAYKNCTSVQGEAYAPCYYGIRNRCTKSCTDSIPAAQWSTDGTASTTGPCAYYWGGCNIVAEWMASCI